ncbi:recombinase family protein [candidate division WWE3 bacterium]|uniref:Recombinase family protein n=1 Tax=candidate division WWE3 bacterium TaxID=2053526 RepID=A0A3A4ZG64_UNCKA|nr:MAG: recombinase family protein [candidate division WWE3 bacterium]
MNDLRYVQYARKSTEAKERQILSIPEQDAENKKYREREGLNVVKEFRESKSAFKSDNRIEFDEMLRMIKRDEADAILTWKPDRLCRNPKEGGEILQLLQNGVIREIRTPLGDVYTPESDQLILLIHFGMANQYSRNISQNVKRSMPYKVARGEYYRAAPIGYENFGEQRGHRNIRPHHFEAPLIKEVFELCAKGGYSLGYLTRFLSEKGLKSKKGKEIAKSNMHSILTSPIYYGYFYYKGELYKGDYVPLISKDTYDAVQVALGDRSVPKVNSWKHPYNGLLKCAECGCAITTSVKKKYYKGTNRFVTYAYHHCTKRKGVCSQKPMSSAKLESIFIDAISKINIDADVWSLGMELVKAKYHSQVNQNNTQLDHFRIEYNRIEGRINRLITMRADAEITAEEFKAQKNSMLEERAKVENKINDTKFSSDNWLERTEEFLNTAFYAKGIIEGKDILKKRKLIMDIGYDLKLDKGNVVVTYRKPFDILLDPAYRTNWQGWKESNPR